MVVARRAAGIGAVLGVVGLAMGAGPGDVLWHVEAPTFFAGYRPTVAPDGVIYWNPGGLVWALSPDGELLHDAVAGEIEGDPVGLGPDGSAYVGDAFSLVAFTPELEEKWSYPTQLGFIAGPSVGPDGNIYAVENSGDAELGAFSLTPEGELRWSIPGFANLGGDPSARVVFGPPDHLYVSTPFAPTGEPLQAGLLAIDLDGNVEWAVARASNGPARQPVVSPVTGRVHIPTQLGQALETFDADGSAGWVYSMPFEVGDIVVPVEVDGAGSSYLLTDLKRVVKVSPDGDELFTTGVIAGGGAVAWMTVSPTGETVAVGTMACFGQACPGEVTVLDAQTGEVLWNRTLPPDIAGVLEARNMAYSPDGSVLYVAAEAFVGDPPQILLAYEVTGACAGDFNGDGALNILDFVAFQNAFLAGEPSADCTGDGALNILDFVCFQNVFQGGCE